MQADWLDLRQAWRATRDGDRKIDLLARAAAMGLPVPRGAVVFARSSWALDRYERATKELSAWLVAEQGRPIGELDAHGVPLMLSLRFGDKHLRPWLPPSISYLGAPPGVFAMELAGQLQRFAAHVGEQPNGGSLAALAASGVRSMGRRGDEPAWFLVQRSVCTFGVEGGLFGTAYTRHPRTGAEIDYGRYLEGASGDRFCRSSGDPAKRELGQLASSRPAVYRCLRTLFAYIEQLFHDVMATEFCVEAERVYLVQTTPRKRVAGLWTPALCETDDTWRGPKDPAGTRRSVWSTRVTLPEALPIEVSASEQTEAARAVAGFRLYRGAGSEEPAWSVHWHAHSPGEFRWDGGRVIEIVGSQNGLPKLGVGFRDAAGRSIIEVPRDACRIVCDVAARRADVVGATRERGGGAYYLKETLRELMRGRLAARGWELLHAASVLFNGRCWLLVGEKAAGKTSTQFSLLEAGAGLFSADRTFVKRGRAIAWPGGLRFAADAVKFAPKLVGRLEQRELAYAPGSRKRRLSFADFPECFPDYAPGPAPIGGYLVLRPEAPRGVRETDWAEAGLERFLIDPERDLRRRWLPEVGVTRGAGADLAPVPVFVLGGRLPPEQLAPALLECMVRGGVA